MFGARGPSVLAVREQASDWGDWGDGGSAWAGPKVSVSSSLQLLAVYGCNRFICEGISTLPTDVFREAGGVRSAVSKPEWLARPTVDLDFVAWCTQVLTSLLLTGNAFVHVRRDGVRVLDATPLDPGSVSVSRERGAKTYRRNGAVIPANEIVHVPGVMFPGADVGLSPVEAARQTIGAGAAVEEFAAKFFSQGANLGGVIEDPGPVDPKKAKETARIWARLHSGNRKAHLPGVLQGGAVWKPTGVTNEQAQFLETRQFTAAMIAAHIFLIDPGELGMAVSTSSNVTYQNLQQRNARKVQVTFLPWITRLEAAITRMLPRPQYFKFNVNGLLRGDPKTQYEMYEVASRINTAAAGLGEPPLLTTAEMRALEDLVPFTGDIPKTAASSAPVVVSSDEAKSLHVHASFPEGFVRNDVRVDPTPIRNDVHVAATPPPVFVTNTVEPTPVMVQAAAAPPARTRRVERDDRGDIVRVVEEG